MGDHRDGRTFIERRMRILTPLRHRDFRLLWTGMTVSLLGDGIFYVALAWQAYELSNTPSALSTIGVAMTVPHVVFLLAGGVVCGPVRPPQGDDRGRPDARPRGRRDGGPSHCPAGSSCGTWCVLSGVLRGGDRLLRSRLRRDRPRSGPGRRAEPGELARPAGTAGRPPDARAGRWVAGSSAHWWAGRRVRGRRSARSRSRSRASALMRATKTSSEEPTRIGDR